MTDLERALAAGGQDVTDYERAIAAGGVDADAPAQSDRLPAAARPRYRMPAPPDDDVDLQPIPEKDARAARARRLVAEGGGTPEVTGADVARGVNNAAVAGVDLIDTPLLGAPRRLYHAAVGAVSPESERQLGDTEEQFHQTPIAGQIPTAMGYVNPVGAPAAVAKGVFAGMGRLAQMAPKPLSRVLASRPVAGAAAGAVTGAATTAAENAVAGRPLDAGVGQSALVAGSLGFAGGAVGATGSRLREHLARNPDRQLIERYGGRITPTSPATGGAFEDPLIKQGIDQGGNVTDAGIGKVARQAAGKVRQSLNDEHAASRGIYANDVEKLRASGATEGYHDFTDLAEEAKRMAEDVERYTGDTRARIKSEILPIIDKYESEGTYLGSAEDVNRLRKKIQKVANYQTPTGVVKDKDIGRLARMAKDVVDETVYAEPNAAYAGRQNELRKAHRALNIPGKSRTHTDPNDLAAEKTLTDTITRRGQNTVTAGKYDTPELDQVIAARPDIAVPMDSAALLRARARMQLTGRNKVGGLIERAAENKRGISRYVDELRDFLMHNGEVIGQRFAYPAADAAARLAPPPAALNLPQAVRRARQQEESAR